MLVGLNWYLSEDESHNADGKHVSYLDTSNRLHAGLASCDGDLILRLADVVRRGRSVRALEASGALPTGAPTYTARLRASFTFRDRNAWHQEALERLSVADVVFADPDNGMRSRRAGPRLEKYALMHELAGYARRGQALVVYHHADRSASATDQAKRRLNDLAEATSQAPIAVVIARRGSCRLFVVTGPSAVQDRLAQSIRRFATRWSAHTTLCPRGSGRRRWSRAHPAGRRGRPGQPEVMRNAPRSGDLLSQAYRAHTSRADFESPRCGSRRSRLT